MSTIKKYQRKPLLGAFQLIIGFFFGYQILDNHDFELYSDWLKLVILVYFTVYGTWKLIIPVVALTKDKITIFINPFKKIQVHLDEFLSINLNENTFLLVKVNEETVEIPIIELSEKVIDLLESDIQEIIETNNN
jgi:hypothetical protein